MQCDFLSWCRNEPENVKEPLWYAMISNLASVRSGGHKFCHEFSMGHPRYTRDETNRKIHQALNTCLPHTCQYINRTGFNCNKDVKSKLLQDWFLRKMEGMNKWDGSAMQNNWNTPFMSWGLIER